MHETNAEFGTMGEENVFGIWAFGLIFIVLGAIAMLYCLRYVGSVWSLLAKHNKQNTVMMAPVFENKLHFFSYYLEFLIFRHGKKQI